MCVVGRGEAIAISTVRWATGGGEGGVAESGRGGMRVGLGRQRIQGPVGAGMGKGLADERPRGRGGRKGGEEEETGERGGWAEPSAGDGRPSRLVPARGGAGAGMGVKSVRVHAAEGIIGKLG